MFVQRVAMPTSRVESWTVLGDDDTPVEPIERYLAYLSAIEKSPNTVKAYAHDLKDYWAFLARRDLDWREVRLEDIGEFIAWLRLPPEGRAGAVAVLPSTPEHVSASTVNRKLSALSAFYLYQVRHGVDLGELLVTWQAPGRRGGFKPFLHHISKGMPQPRRTIALKTPKKLPRVLATTEIQAILNACTRLRDRFLLAVLVDCGVRIGEALGLRHEDIGVAERHITIVPRVNDNGARSKSRQVRTVPASDQLIRLYGDYVHQEFGDLDSDYVLSGFRDNTYCPDLAVIPSNGLVCWSAGWMCCGCQIKLAWLQAFEEGEELVWGLVAAGWHVRWCDSVQRLFLQLEVGVGVDLRGADVLVP